MSSFSDSNFAKKLAELNNTQQSIQTLSLWLIHHRKHSKSVVQVWHREILKVKGQRKLHFIYLANDVIQNSKKKGPEFAKDFGTVLLDAYRNAAKEADDKTKQTMDRILNIWQDRGVYDKEFISQMRQAMKGKSYKTRKEKSSSSSSSKDSSTPENTPTVKKKKSQPEQSLTLQQEIEALDDLGESPVPEDLAKALTNLESTASSDAAVRERIAALPQEVADTSHLEKLGDKEAADKLSVTVDEACSLLTDYNQRLAAELEDRKETARMLHAYLISQRELLLQAQKRQEEYKGKLAKVKTVRQELKSHIQNLPDLTLLPDVTGGLAPLPSAGDLFSIDQHQ